MTDVSFFMNIYTFLIAAICDILCKVCEKYCKKTVCGKHMAFFVTINCFFSKEIEFWILQYHEITEIQVEATAAMLNSSQEREEEPALMSER